MPLHAFCRQISSREFEEQRLTVSQTAIAELLDLLLADSGLAGKERRKKLRQVHTSLTPNIPSEIGRASCRERVSSPV